MCMCVILGLRLVAEDVLDGSGNRTDIGTEGAADTAYGEGEIKVDGVLNFVSRNILFSLNLKYKGICTRAVVYLSWAFEILAER